MNICFLAGDISRGAGTERVCLQVAGGLAARGHRVWVVSLAQTRGVPPRFPVPPQVEIRTLLGRLPHIRMALCFYPVVVRRLAQWVRQERIAYIVTADAILDIFALPVKKITPVRVISWEHFNFHAAVGNPLRRSMRRVSARWADGMVVLTQADRENFQRRFKHPGRKAALHQVYNPLPLWDTPAYNAKARRIVSAGRLVRQKGFDRLLDTAAQLPWKGGWRWEVAGEGPAHAALVAKTQRLGLGHRVIWRGHVQDMDAFYEDAAFFVLTSRYEGFGLVVAEAQRHRLPVAAFDCPVGPAELITHGRNGFLSPNGDVAALARHMGLFMADAPLRQAFASHAQEGLHAFNPAYILNQWEEILHGAI